MAQAYDMSNKACEEHLRGGGTFEAQAGALRLRYLPEDDFYVLVNRTGNGGSFAIERFAQVQDLMDQLGGLATWEARPAPRP